MARLAPKWWVGVGTTVVVAVALVALFTISGERAIGLDSESASTSGAEVGGVLVTAETPMFAALRRQATEADREFPTDQPGVRALVSEKALDLSSARRVVATARGAAWLIRSPTAGLCFILIEASGVVVNGCLPEEWAASHGGFAVTSGDETNGKATGPTQITGVVPQGSSGAIVTDDEGSTTPVPLNQDDAYDVVVTGRPARFAYTDSRGVRQQRPYASGAGGA